MANYQRCTYRPTAIPVRSRHTSSSVRTTSLLPTVPVSPKGVPVCPTALKSFPDEQTGTHASQVDPLGFLRNNCTTFLFGMDESQLAGVILFSTSLLGVLVHITIVTLIGKVSALRNSFGTLTLNQALSECILVAVFAFYFAPAVFLDSSFLKSPDVSRIFSHVCLVCYDVTIYNHLLISFNRFVAIYSPFSYSLIFGDKIVRFMIAITWIAAVAPTFYTLIIADCRVIYEDDHWNFNFISTPICQWIAWYTDFFKYVAFICAIGIVDLSTFIRVHLTSARISHQVNDESQRKRRKDELNFVKQVCLQGVFFVLELITYFVLSNYTTNKWIKFFFTTYAWSAVHVIDGIITLTFNNGFFTVMKKIVIGFNKTQSSSSLPEK